MKTRLFLPLSLLIFTLACNALGAAATATPVPSPTPPPPATDTAVPVPPTATPVLAFFRDDFNQALANGWTWQNENPANWNLESERGWLQITTSPGEIINGDYSNLLVRLAPTGNFLLETHIRFQPSADFQFAGLIIYQSDVDLLLAGRAFCSPSDLCAGNGLYFDNFINSSFQGQNFATAYTSEEVYLRLQRAGDFYTFSSSSDGAAWTEIGAQRNGLDPLLIGLWSGQNTGGQNAALFDYFQVTGLP